MSDRQKYVIDQFLMRGGTVVLFADAADYGIAPRRQFNKLPVRTDAQDSRFRFKDQLLHYGVDVRDQVVADLFQQAYTPRNALFQPYEYYARPAPGGRGMSFLGYPYFMHAMAVDWKDTAAQLANNDATLAERYRKILRPGIDSEAFLFEPFKKIKRGPGFYWPCWTDLRRKGGEADLPDGVTGEVLLWSSPLAVVQDPPASLDPLGGGDFMAQNSNYQQFIARLNQTVQSEQRRQAPLMVDVSGTFPSFFAGKERPKKPAELKYEEAVKQREEGGEPGEEAAEEPGDDPLAQKPEQGPPVPEELQDPELVPPEPEAAMRTSPSAPGRIVVVGDSDFLRDDLVRGVYANQGGPYSLLGASFFFQMLDWLSQDDDLVALQSRVEVDRRLSLAPAKMGGAEDPRDAQKRLRARRNVLIWTNITVPCAVLLLLGLSVILSRRAQKRRFLQTVGNR